MTTRGNTLITFYYSFYTNACFAQIPLKILQNDCDEFNQVKGYYMIETEFKEDRNWAQFEEEVI